MTDKKGSRDISELKARLGLKKGAAGGAGAPAAQTSARTNGGVVPPPGLNLPPPPGVTPPQPPQPVIPNAADDPFGAMNAMAAVGTVQRAPEIVIVNDGKPVESVGGGRSTGAKVARIAVPAVVALALGMGLGRISKGANVYNDGLKGAAAILGDASNPAPTTVIATKKIIADLDTQLETAQKTSSFKPDLKLDNALDSFAKKLDINANAIYAAPENTMPADVRVEITTFYASVAEIKSLLDAHKKLSAGEDQLLKAQKAMESAKVGEKDSAILNQAGIIKYGVLIQAPDSADPKSSQEFGAKLVELGPQYCGDKPTTTGSCDGGGKLEIGQRGEPGGIFNKTEVATSGTDSVPTKKIVLLLANGVRDAFIKGNEATVSEVYYTARLKDLQKRVKKLLDDANKLQQHLEAEKNKSTQFSFFM